MLIKHLYTSIYTNTPLNEAPIYRIARAITKYGKGYLCCLFAREREAVRNASAFNRVGDDALSSSSSNLITPDKSRLYNTDFTTMEPILP